MLYIFITLPTLAAAMTGIALNDFSTENPSETFNLQLNDGIVINGYQIISQGAILHGKVVKVVNGQIGKRTGYFVFNPSRYVLNSKDTVPKKIQDPNFQIKVSYYAPFSKDDAKKILETGAGVAAETIFRVPFLSEGISFVKGVVKPDEDCDNRIISGVKQAYEDSPVSYIEKGGPLILQTGQQVKINFVDKTN